MNDLEEHTNKEKDYTELRAKMFASTLKYLLSENDKYQQDLVNDLGVSKATVSTWCNGKKVPRPEMLNRLSSYFNIPEYVFFEGIDSKNPEIDPLALQTAILIKRNSAKDVEFLRAYNMLDEKDKETIRDLAIRLSKKE